MNGSHLAPFLNIDVTLALLQSSGTSPLLRDLLKIIFRDLANCCAKSRKNYSGILSGSCADYGFKFVRACSTFSRVKVISGGIGIDLESSLVNTLLK